MINEANENFRSTVNIDRKDLENDIVEEDFDSSDQEQQEQDIGLHLERSNSEESSDSSNQNNIAFEREQTTQTTRRHDESLVSIMKETPPLRKPRAKLSSERAVRMEIQPDLNCHNHHQHDRWIGTEFPDFPSLRSYMKHTQIKIAKLNYSLDREVQLFPQFNGTMILSSDEKHLILTLKKPKERT